jgi:putative SOS response-associated peptidase YedK
MGTGVECTAFKRLNSSEPSGLVYRKFRVNPASRGGVNTEFKRIGSNMCGRYDFFPGEFADLRIRFNLDKDLRTFKHSYNIAPGKDVPVIVRHGDRNTVKLMRWGLVPSWSPDSSIGDRMINARCETLDQRASFKQLLARNRCLIPADGFYEWVRIGKGKIPMRVRMKDQKPFTMAGLWNLWRDPDGEMLYSFTIITTLANKLLRPIHNRMPLILDPLVAKQWLDPTSIDPRMISVVMQPFPSELMEAYEVSRLVNDPKNDSPACIDPALPEPPGPLLTDGPTNRSPPETWKCKNTRAISSTALRG